MTCDEILHNSPVDMNGGVLIYLNLKICDEMLHNSREDMNGGVLIYLNLCPLHYIFHYLQPYPLGVNTCHHKTQCHSILDMEEQLYGTIVHNFPSLGCDITRRQVTFTKAHPLHFTGSFSITSSFSYLAIQQGRTGTEMKP